MATLDLNSILGRVNGRLLSGSRIGPTQSVMGVSTDTRTIKAGELFVALNGATFDGHDFIETALAHGATAVICSRWPEKLPAVPVTADGGPVAVILCENTLAAYQAVACFRREQFTAPVIAITGSVGKTSTRGMIAACLSSRLKVHQTRANLNNEIGLPSTLLATPDDAQAVVVEMGMRAAGEIAVLSRIARPDVAVITNIGHSHIEFLGSQEGILKAKLEIADFLAADGLLILNADDPLLLSAGRDFIRSGARRIAFVSTLASFCEPGAVCCLCASDIVSTSGGVRFTARLHDSGPDVAVLDEAGVYVPSPGMHQVINALFGLLCAHEAGLSLTEAAIGAQTFSNTGSRQRIIRVDTLTVMDDSYNASPESMQAAMQTLQTLAAPDQGRLVGVLGGMLELGDFAAQAHELIGQTAAKTGFSALFLTGPQAPDVARGARSVKSDLPIIIRDDVEQLSSAVICALHDGDFILVKGSRGFHMERIVAAIESTAAEHGLIPSRGTSAQATAQATEQATAQATDQVSAQAGTGSDKGATT